MPDLRPEGRRLQTSFDSAASWHGGTDRGVRAGFLSASTLRIPEMRWNLELARFVKRELCVF